MGLKSGSSGDPYDSDDEEVEESVEGTGVESTETAETSVDDSGTTEPSTPRLPYIHRRSKVNEGRDQVPFFLRDFVRDGEDDLRDAVEGRLGESVPKSDVREAAMLVAQENEDLVAAKLREWGYDYD